MCLLSFNYHSLFVDFAVPFFNQTYFSSDPLILNEVTARKVVNLKAFLIHLPLLLRNLYGPRGFIIRRFNMLQIFNPSFDELLILSGDQTLLQVVRWIRGLRNLGSHLFYIIFS